LRFSIRPGAEISSREGIGDRSCTATAERAESDRERRCLRAAGGGAGGEASGNQRGRRAGRPLGFVLEGSHARGLTLLARGRALLTFKQFAAGEAAGATVAGAKLDALREGEQTLTISVTPEDGLAIDGPHSGSAQFREGELLQAVPFALRALPASVGECGECGVHVEFHHAGARLYEFRLPIIVLPRGRALPALVSPLAIDLDARQAVQAAGDVGRPPRRFRLKACFENNQLYLSFDDYVDGEINCSIEGFAYSIDRARFDALRGELATTLDANLYASSSVWDAFDGSDTTAPGVQRQLTRVTGQFAQAGGVLYRALREDAKWREILDYIEANGDSGTRVTIITRELSLAWELLYPQRFDPDDAERWPLQPGLLLGCALCAGNAVAGRRRLRRPAEDPATGEREPPASTSTRRSPSPRISCSRSTPAWPARCGRNPQASKSGSMTTARAFATWWSRRRPGRR
jgi:hypothetical protein